MATIIQDISNCPTTGLSRKVELHSFRWDDILKNVVIDLYVKYFKDGDPVIKKGIKTWDITLIADNTTLVDPATGEYLEIENDPETGLPIIPVNSVGQYDFFIALAGSGPVDIFGLIRLHIAVADQRGRYDENEN